MSFLAVKVNAKSLSMILLSRLWCVFLVRPVSLHCCLSLHYCSLLKCFLTPSIISCCQLCCVSNFFMFSYVRVREVYIREVRNRLNIKKDLMQAVMKRKLGLFGHICRMEDNRKIKRVMLERGDEEDLTESGRMTSEIGADKIYIV